MAKERSSNYPPVVLCLASALLLSAGWLMTSFPIFIFLGLAPLFALTDRADNTAGIWEKMEWVLIALTVHFLAARAFDFSFTASSILYAILFTLPFIGQIWMKQVLGSKAGKITIILFWLAIEYTILKIDPGHGVYLADAVQQKAAWTHWNMNTGYLGASLWILVVNLLVYQTLFSKTSLKWHWIILTVIALAGPIVYSYSQSSYLSRETMLNLYDLGDNTGNVTYLARGEFVVRTAAWISTLIILFTFVKAQTTKR
ncbi:MAG TPA: hypothetical protein VG737_15435 [Cyclobacteriaceae bacterium]|nr:hypothetical protein [Cyclobacteriaceae bacterium]